MLDADGIGRYHFCITDNNDGCTFDYDVDFESDIVIVESHVAEPVRVTAILGKAQKEDLLNSIRRCRILDLKGEPCPEGCSLWVKSEGKVDGRPFRTVVPLLHNNAVQDFTIHLLSISQYLGIKDSVVDHWRSALY